MLAAKKRANIALIGHRSSGKSTVVGHMLCKSGAIGEREIQDLEELSKKVRRNEMKYAWVSDEKHEERENVCSIDIKHRTLNKDIESDNHVVMLIDTPGRREYVSNMIVGTTQADCAVLVVSAAPGEFEAGISEDGLTEEHLRIARSMGVEHFVVAVNKMDLTVPPYSEERFNEIVSATSRLLGECGIWAKTVPFVPISGWQGDNLAEASERMPWYKGWKVRAEIKEFSGKTLSKCLEAFAGPRFPMEESLRIPISDVCRSGGFYGVTVTGCIKAGSLRPDMDLVVAPSGVPARMDELESDGEMANRAGVGSIVKINLQYRSPNDIKRGYVIGEDRNDPPKAAKSFVAHLSLLKTAPTISAGFSADVHCHTAQAVCVFEELTQKTDSRSGEPQEEMPGSVGAGDGCTVKVVPREPICVEEIQKSLSLGRLVIRSKNRTIAVGIVRSVEH